ncbi:peroxisomal targeting signal type 2 receptor, putative [Bodo saltans]|uniref:Peroxin-7 n=1 Tax=Bodo saltans TaxID=75058 RepID=A0A0S4JHX6_BODSA|nr:peroxisomal targeting signal type 2 receptor, putative [Bodo saltans]|eukprot:CUG89525.1 peroxisomal targeting signal type 2 receptor, putative [Bodo saltans]
MVQLHLVLFTPQNVILSIKHYLVLSLQVDHFIDPIWFVLSHKKQVFGEMPSLPFHQGFAGQSVRCNPWIPSQFIITAADNFGVTGSGKVYLVEWLPDHPPNAPMKVIGCFGTSDGAFDACFSEMDPNIIAVACGDGVKLYNIQSAFNCDGAMPLVAPHDHQGEVVCAAWNQVSKDSFYTSSWDGTVRVWGALQPQTAAMVLQGHMKEVYEVSPAPRDAHLLLSCSGDGFWKLWDVRKGPQAVIGAPGHNNQIILSIDWNKYDPNCFLTGGVDQLVKLWDIRRPQQEAMVLRGHQGPVRRVRCSPHARTQVASSGYDYRVAMWDLGRPQRPLTHRYEQHKEFVVGLDWSLIAPGCVVSAAWDGFAFFQQAGLPPTHSPPCPLAPALPPPRGPGNRRRGQGGPMAR